MEEVIKRALMDYRVLLQMKTYSMSAYVNYMPKRGRLKRFPYAFYVLDDDGNTASYSCVFDYPGELIVSGLTPFRGIHLINDP